jgi:hypothetical protein
MPLTESQIAQVRKLLSESGGTYSALKYIDSTLGGIGLRVAAELLNALASQFNSESDWKYVAPYPQIRTPEMNTSSTPRQVSDSMFVYNWWRPDRYIASIDAGEDRFYFPRYYFVREVVGIVADSCLSDDQLSLVQSPYEYGIAFIESAPEVQARLVSQMKGIAPQALHGALQSIRGTLESDMEVWKSELSGDAHEYVRVLGAAEAFLLSRPCRSVLWCVHYNE